MKTPSSKLFNNIIENSIAIANIQKHDLRLYQNLMTNIIYTLYSNIFYSRFYEKEYKHKNAILTNINLTETLDKVFK